MGVSRVAAIDINESRLEFAQKNGFAHQTFCFPSTDKPKNTEEQLRRAKDNATTALAAFGKEEGFDVVFECSGAESSIQMSVHVSPDLLTFLSILLSALFNFYFSNLCSFTDLLSFLFDYP